MKILHIFDGYGTPGERVLPGQGSIPEVVYRLAKYSSEMGHDVTILERDHGKWKRKEILNGIKYYRLRSKSLPAPPYKLIRSITGITRLSLDAFKLAFEINKYIKSEDFDIIHCHFPFAVNILVSLDRKVREKIVYTAHIGDEGKRLGISKKDVPFALRLFSPDIYLIKRVSKVTVMHEGLKSKLISYFGIRSDKIFVIPHGVDTKIFDKINNKTVAEGIKERIIILSATRVVPEKGIHILIKAIDHLVNNQGIKELMLIVAGDISHDPDYFAMLNKFVYSRKLENYVKFTGHVEYNKLLRLYCNCDIFVYPLLSEGGVSIAILEALAAAKPIIATKIGGLHKQVIDSWNGFLIEPGNDKQLAEKIRYLIENEEERKKMGINSRELAKKEFDWRKIVRKYIDVYENVIGR